MSTRSNIGILDENGYLAIYCHSDGYTDGVGRTLYYHYQDEARIRSLLALGAISVLEEKIGDPSWSIMNLEHRRATGQHCWNYDYREDGVTVAYHRDRGDELLAGRLSGLCEEEYSYAFDLRPDSPTHGTWLYSDHGKPLAPLSPLFEPATEETRGPAVVVATTGGTTKVFFLPDAAQAVFQLDDSKRPNASMTAWEMRLYKAIEALGADSSTQSVIRIAPGDQIPLGSLVTISFPS